MAWPCVSGDMVEVAQMIYGSDLVDNGSVLMAIFVMVWCCLKYVMNVKRFHCFFYFCVDVFDSYDV